MDDRRLRDILMRADATITPPAASDLVGGAIRRRSQWRRRRMIAGAVCASVLIVILFHARPIPLTPRSTEISRADVFTPSDQAQIDIATRAVNDLLVNEKLAATQDRLEKAQAQLIDLRQQREDIAAALLGGAADLTDGRQQAAYRQVVQFFPGTGAAAVAQQRLASIQ